MTNKNEGFFVYWYEGDEKIGDYCETAYQAIVHAADISYEKQTTVWIKDLAKDADLPVGAYGGEIYSDYYPAEEFFEEDDDDE